MSLNFIFSGLGSKYYRKSLYHLFDLMQAINQLHQQLQEVSNKLHQVQNDVEEKEDKLKQLEIDIRVEKSLIIKVNDEIKELKENLVKGSSSLNDMIHGKTGTLINKVFLSQLLFTCLF